MKRNVVFMGIVSFLVDAHSETIIPLLPLFLSNVLGVSKAYIGLIEGIAEGTASLVQVLSGWLSDRVKNRKWLVFSGYALSTAVKPLLALAQSGSHVLAIRFSDRVGKGIRTAPRDALIADSVDEKHRGIAFGFHRAMDTGGAIVGTLMAFFLLSLFNGNFQKTFLVAAIPGFLAVLVVLLLVKETPERSQVQKRVVSLRLSMFSRPFKIFIAANILFSLANFSDAFMILRTQELGVAAKIVPLVYLVYNIIYALCSMPAGKLSDRVGRKIMLQVTYTLYGLVYLGFAFAGASWHAWVLYAIYGIHSGIVNPISRALVADLVPSNLRGTAMGVYQTSTGLAALPASIFAGLLWQHWGSGAAFATAAALAMAAMLLLTVLRTTPVSSKQ